jgi:DNA polymerase
MIVAAEGHRLLVCDFAAIEARVLAWLAGQKDLVSQFARGDDVYTDMASAIYGCEPSDVEKHQRQVGKVAILGLVYSMGPLTFRRACKTMAGVIIDGAMARQIVKAYRARNQSIQKLWSDVNTAAIQAVESGNKQFVSSLSFERQGSWLKVRLPSERCLHYRRPEVVNVRAPWSKGYTADIRAPLERQEDIEDKNVSLGEREGDRWLECDIPTSAFASLRTLTSLSNIAQKPPQMIRQVQYWGVDSVNGRWGRIRTYGGKLVENVVQAIARDFMADAMLRVESAGYPIVMTVHDEVVAERKLWEGTLAEFEAIVAEVPGWGRGCPINVEGFEARRYKK